MLLYKYSDSLVGNSMKSFFFILLYRGIVSSWGTRLPPAVCLVEEKTDPKGDKNEVWPWLVANVSQETLCKV